MTTRSYSQLYRLKTFEERWKYLSLRGNVGQATFGFDRYVNQMFYTSRMWKQTRWDVISRDEGCDLGIRGFEIHSRILIHHMNPVSLEQITEGDESLLDPEFLITTTHGTHNAIHYGDEKLLPRPFVERTRGDTKLW